MTFIGVLKQFLHIDVHETQPDGVTGLQVKSDGNFYKTAPGASSSVLITHDGHKHDGGDLDSGIVPDPQLPARIRAMGGPYCADTTYGVALEAGSWWCDAVSVGQPEAGLIGTGYTHMFRDDEFHEHAHQWFYDRDTARVWHRSLPGGGWLPLVQAFSDLTGVADAAQLPGRTGIRFAGEAAPVYGGSYDDIKTPGTYAVINGVGNAPGPGECLLHVDAWDGNWVSQTAWVIYGTTGGPVVHYSRQWNLSAWSEWKPLGWQTFAPITHEHPFSQITGQIADTQLPARLSFGSLDAGATTSDFNTLTIMGEYTALPYSANSPHPGTDEYWYVRVSRVNSAWITQDAWQLNPQASDTKAWRRYYYSDGTWDEWFRLREGALEQDNRFSQLGHGHPFTQITGVAANDQIPRNQQRFGVAGLSISQMAVASLAASALEVELSFQSLITMGESASGDANPAVTWYRTSAGYRAGRAFRQVLTSSNGPFKWQTGEADAAYGSETFSDLMSLDLNGALHVTGGVTAAGQQLVDTNDPRLTDYRYPSNDADLIHKSLAEDVPASKNFLSGILIRDVYHGLQYVATTEAPAFDYVDGPRLFGYAGGELGYKSTGTFVRALKWSASGVEAPLGLTSQGQDVVTTDDPRLVLPTIIDGGGP